MKVELKVKGMSCMHCVASVKSALEEVSGVDSVNVSLDNGTACLECEDTINVSDLISAVEEQGFDAALSE